MAAYFEELHNFHQNLDNLNFLVPLQKYIPECQPKDYKSFNLKAITWNRFLVKYQKLFDICDDNTDIKTIEAKAKQFYKYIEYFRSWDDLPSYWYMDFKGLPGCDKEALIMSNSVKPGNDYIELEKL
ncbi:hypothetical protein [Rickettsia conorii]|uniref:hypothetical protein n=1 Tax=Rickettsia conorii TaxID=781 RepID=UPI002B401D51|nr:hypothetical protein [Rickettsia conorii]